MTEKMRSQRSAHEATLVGIAMVRDEIDIIDAWLDHALGVLDGLAVVAHNCSDGTLERLVARAQAGAPIAVLRQSSETFRQGETMTEVARSIAVRFRPDWIFALDADEFLVADSRAAIEASLRALPQGAVGLIPWRTHLPPEPGAGGLLERASRCLEDEPAPQCKAVFAAEALGDPEVVIVEGSHGLARLRPEGLIPLPHERVPGVALAHVPVRSDAQLRRKVIGGERAIRPIRREGSAMAWHWAQLAARLADAPPLSHDALDEIALRYYAFAEASGPCQRLPSYRIARRAIECPRETSGMTQRNGVRFTFHY